MVLRAGPPIGLATLYASHMVFIDPHQFASPVLVSTIILYVVVGGMGTVRGPVLGAALLYPLGEVLRGEFADQAGLHMVVFGLAIILIVLFAPSGLSDRKSVVWGKSVSVRVDLGGRRIIKKKIIQILISRELSYTNNIT